MSEANKQIVHAFAEAGNRNDEDAFDILLAPDFVRHCEATPEVNVTSREDFKQFYRDTVRTFPDQRMTLEQLVADFADAAERARRAGLLREAGRLAGRRQGDRRSQVSERRPCQCPGPRQVEAPKTVSVFSRTSGIGRFW